ncbi:DUF4268 domain-containing protein [Maribacter sp. 2-571]|uniref:DUF4268 domain-containing protein n=1 Tax=Maribacter sp. 2-571 TaxID=3417569 RepID=UPI003D341763
MFSKEASKRLRQDFWISFGKSYPKKWIRYKTGIKDLAFKFHFDRNMALVSLQINTHDLEHRITLWERLTSLKTILLQDYLHDAIFEETGILEDGKEVSRIIVIKENVSIHDKNTWQETMLFLNEKMLSFEDFFDTYKTVLDYPA